MAMPRSGSREHNLPFPLTSLVGRSRELEGVGAALRRTRLVSLTGPGGVGKTRLALEVGHREARRRTDGIWLVELASAPGTPDVAAETARTLGIAPPRGADTVDALRGALAGRETLLVLDNCEHVVDACASLAANLLASCAELRILATSRESLGVNGETVWRLEPLAAEDAYRLFVSGRGNGDRSSCRATRRKQRSASSARGSTASHSRSSSRRPGSAPSLRRKC